MTYRRYRFRWWLFSMLLLVIVAGSVCFLTQALFGAPVWVTYVVAAVIGILWPTDIVGRSFAQRFDSRGLW